MKYITKEWYESCQVISFFSYLRVSNKAALFSEDYFKKLYKKAEKDWISELEEMSKIQITEFRITHPSEEVNFNDASRGALDNAMDSLRVEPYMFNLKQEKKKYKKTFQNRVNMLHRILPKDILQKVADIRVLALNCSCADVKKEIKAFCKARKKAVNSVSDAYWNEFGKSFGDGEPAFLREFNFHDSTIASCRKKGKNLVITFTEPQGLQNIRRIILKNCSIIKQDKLLHGAWWLYREIYKIQGGYEIHVLLEKEVLIDFIIRLTDVEYNN